MTVESVCRLLLPGVRTCLSFQEEMGLLFPKPVRNSTLGNGTTPTTTSHPQHWTLGALSTRHTALHTGCTARHPISLYGTPPSADISSLGRQTSSVRQDAPRYLTWQVGAGVCGAAAPHDHVHPHGPHRALHSPHIPGRGTGMRGWRQRATKTGHQHKRPMTVCVPARPSLQICRPILRTWWTGTLLLSWSGPIQTNASHEGLTEGMAHPSVQLPSVAPQPPSLTPPTAVAYPPTAVGYPPTGRRP